MAATTHHTDNLRVLWRCSVVNNKHKERNSTMIIVEDVAYIRIIDSFYIMNFTFGKRETLFTSSQSLQSLNMATES